jgi:predicted MPP superfamily phosphohydrolase
LVRSFIQGSISTDQVALLGRLGCDAPPRLVQYIFELFNKINAKEPVDYIIITGDLIAHDVSADPEDQGTKKGAKLYKTLKKTHVEVQQIFSEYFPDIPVFYSFGNNDCKYHNSAPFQEEKEEFYDFMWNLWFVNHKPNRKYATHKVEKTFKKGGYYIVDLEDGVSVMSMNTLVFNGKQYQPEIGTQAEEQLQWIEHNLNKNGKKFVTIQHIYPAIKIKKSATPKLK